MKTFLNKFHKQLNKIDITNIIVVLYQPWFLAKTYNCLFSEDNCIDFERRKNYIQTIVQTFHIVLKSKLTESYVMKINKKEIFNQNKFLFVGLSQITLI